LLKFTYLRPMNEMCITQRYVIIAYLLADREQRIEYLWHTLLCILRRN